VLKKEGDYKKEGRRPQHPKDIFHNKKKSKEERGQERGRKYIFINSGLNKNINENRNLSTKKNSLPTKRGNPITQGRRGEKTPLLQ